MVHYRLNMDKQKTLRIENCSLADVKNGEHTDFGPNTILIQITDPAMEPPIPAKNFHSVFQYEFLDIDDSDIEKDGNMEEFAINDDQANELVELLRFAQEKELNVLVMCHMGICRSGAVTEVAEILGFEPTPRFRSPNLRVKHKMMKVLGLTYDSEEKPYMVHTEDGEVKKSSPTYLWD